MCRKQTGLGSPKKGFSTSAQVAFGLVIHCSVRGSPTHCDCFSSIPGLYSLDSRSITPLLPQVMVIRVICRHYQVSPSGERQSLPPREPLSQGHSSLSSPVLLFIMYCCKSIYSKFTLAYSWLVYLYSRPYTV